MKMPSLASRYHDGVGRESGRSTGALRVALYGAWVGMRYSSGCATLFGHRYLRGWLEPSVGQGRGHARALSSGRHFAGRARSSFGDKALAPRGEVGFLNSSSRRAFALDAPRCSSARSTNSARPAASPKTTARALEEVRRGFVHRSATIQQALPVRRP